MSLPVHPCLLTPLSLLSFGAQWGRGCVGQGSVTVVEKEVGAWGQVKLASFTYSALFDGPSETGPGRLW